MALMPVADALAAVLAGAEALPYLAFGDSEAMEIGDRVLVCHRPARIAFEARMDREASAGARQEIHEKIMEVLSLETPASG